MPKTFNITATYKANTKMGKLIFEIDETFYQELEKISNKLGEDVYLPFWKTETEDLNLDDDLKDLEESQKFFIKIKDNEQKHKKENQYKLKLSLSIVKGDLLIDGQIKNTKALYFTIMESVAAASK